ncbi:MAG: class I SAM-dependent methyltransferase [Candidatus Sulfotelmatobacter sp.]|jgi:SAM-dependent methyltransferase
MDSPPQIGVRKTAWQWWRYAATYEGSFRATRRLLGVLWEFARDSTPERLRQRFGDADYDWDYRVNTTSGAVGWRDRLLGMFHSAYQPTEPAAFHEMLDALHQAAQQTPRNPEEATLDFRDFTFVDLGCGKGRTLLMASDYPFRKIIGVELLPALHQIALDNLRQYKSAAQKCFALETICADATAFPFPEGPLVLYLFNPFPESGMRRVVANLAESLRADPRPVYVLYHNPLLEHTLSENGALKKVSGAPQYSLFSNVGV